MGGDPWPIYIDPTGQQGVKSGINTDTIVKPDAVPGKEITLEEVNEAIESGRI